jgi:hypothetical protein
MNKTILIISLLILTLTQMSCVSTSILSDAEYSTEINVNKSKDSLFVECNLWAVDVFNSSKTVIQYSDKEYGVFKGKYVIDYFNSESFTTEYKGIFTVYVDDNYTKLIIKPYGTSIYNEKMLYDKIYFVLKSFHNYFNKPDPKYEFEIEKPKSNNNTYRYYNNPIGR